MWGIVVAENRLYLSQVSWNSGCIFSPVKRVVRTKGFVLQERGCLEHHVEKESEQCPGSVGKSTGLCGQHPPSVEGVGILCLTGLPFITCFLRCGWYSIWSLWLSERNYCTHHLKSGGGGQMCPRDFKHSSPGPGLVHCNEAECQAL